MTGNFDNVFLCERFWSPEHRSEHFINDTPIGVTYRAKMSRVRRLL
jgi:hypothetical protein